MRHVIGVLRRLLSPQVLTPGLAVVLLAGVATVSTGAIHDGHSRPPTSLTAEPPSPTPVIPTTVPATFPTADLKLFRAADRHPAATAPVRKLPKVDVAALTVEGIPIVALHAYQRAVATVATTDPGCHLRWWLVAGIGLVESGHAHTGGSTVAGWNGVARPPILGPILNGSHHFMAIHDTDDGVYDGNKTWDRAVGPMQFLPSTWTRWGPPTKSGKPGDPQNIRAAALATSEYLCASGLALGAPKAMALAVYSYNHSFDYVRLVLSVAARYAGLSPDQLGVNRLPHDKDIKKHRHAKKHRHHRKRPADSTTTASTRPTRSPSATTSSASPTPSPSGSPSGGPSPKPSPLPVPTLTPPPLH